MKDREKSNKIIIIAVVLIIVALSIVIVITWRERKEELTDNTITSSIGDNINNNQKSTTTNDNTNTATNNSTDIESIESPENITTVNTLKETNETNINNTTKIISQLSPSGFAGSSMMKVVLYEDKSVYLLHYDGEGYNEENIFNKELLATNVDSIYSKGEGEDFESIVLKGEKIQIVSTSYNWISFE